MERLLKILIALVCLEIGIHIMELAIDVGDFMQ